MMMRTRLWSVRIVDVELEYASMLESPRVDELMARADVALVNNKVFSETREFPPFRLSIAPRV